MMKAGDLVYLNPDDAGGELQMAQLISRKGDVENLWAVRIIKTGEKRISFINPKADIAGHTTLTVIPGGKS